MDAVGGGDTYRSVIRIDVEDTTQEGFGRASARLDAFRRDVTATTTGLTAFNRALASAVQRLEGMAGWADSASESLGLFNRAIRASTAGVAQMAAPLAGVRAEMTGLAQGATRAERGLAGVAQSAQRVRAATGTMGGGVSAMASQVNQLGVALTMLQGRLGGGGGGGGIGRGAARAATGNPLMAGRGGIAGALLRTAGESQMARYLPFVGAVGGVGATLGLAGVAMAAGGSLAAMRQAEEWQRARMSLQPRLGAGTDPFVAQLQDVYRRSGNATQVIGAGRELIGTGTAPDQAARILRSVSNLQQATGGDPGEVQQIARGFAQMQQTGRFDTGLAESLRRAGVDVTGAIGGGLQRDLGITRTPRQINQMIGSGEIPGRRGSEWLLRGLDQYETAADRMRRGTVGGVMGELGRTFDVDLVQRYGRALEQGVLPGLDHASRVLETSSASSRAWGNALETVARVAAAIGGTAVDIGVSALLGDAEAREKAFLNAGQSARTMFAKGFAGGFQGLNTTAGGLADVLNPAALIGRGLPGYVRGLLTVPDDMVRPGDPVQHAVDVGRRARRLGRPADEPSATSDPRTTPGMSTAAQRAYANTTSPAGSALDRIGDWVQSINPFAATAASAAELEPWERAGESLSSAADRLDSAAGNLGSATGAPFMPTGTGPGGFAGTPEQGGGGTPIGDVGALTRNQFTDQGLRSAFRSAGFDEHAVEEACGPIAAAGMARALGRGATEVQAATAGQRAGVWSPTSGVTNAQGGVPAMLGALGVRAHAAGEQEAMAALRAGQPAIINTGDHYFLGTGMDAAGRVAVGETGRSFRGGSANMTLAEMTRGGANPLIRGAGFFVADAGRRAGGIGPATDKAGRLLQIAEQARAAGLDPAGVQAALSVADAEGGMFGRLGDRGTSGGTFQLHAGGQLDAFARSRGMSNAGALGLLQRDPDAANAWALGQGGYLGGAIRRGEAAGMGGAELARYAERYGQGSAPAGWQNAAQSYGTLFGGGGRDGVTVDVGGIHITLPLANAHDLTPEQAERWAQALLQPVARQLGDAMRGPSQNMPQPVGR